MPTNDFIDKVNNNKIQSHEQLLRNQ